MTTNAPRALAVDARLRARNQLTLPDSVVQALGLTAGDRFMVDVDPADTDVIRLRRFRTSYSGVLADVYGDADAALNKERDSWPSLAT